MTIKESHLPNPARIASSCNGRKVSNPQKRRTASRIRSNCERFGCTGSMHRSISQRLPYGEREYVILERSHDYGYLGDLTVVDGKGTGGEVGLIGGGK